MAFEDRLKIMREIEESRGSTVICYLTSLRNNVASSIADDAVRTMFNHLGNLPAKGVTKLDLFLCSNGGSGVVPWRLVTLFREYAERFSVLIPYRAYSAATLISLGADEIVMHKFGELGPIDPTVTNPFNPVDAATQQKIGISVEDVQAYIQFVKKTAGITHQDELVRTIEILAKNVHPLALGNVERFLSQSRMIAKKILKSQHEPPIEHKVNEIVENMAAKLFFHGHPINRREAKEDLDLNVETPEPRLAECMWNLYLDFEAEFKNLDPYRPAASFAANAVSGDSRVDTLLHTMIESRFGSTRQETDQRWTISFLPQVPPTKQFMSEEVATRWVHLPPTSDANQVAPTGT